jgi:hypothetical protein
VVFNLVVQSTQDEVLDPATADVAAGQDLPT